MIDDPFANMNNTQSVTFTIDTIAPIINNVSSNATTVGSSTVINLTANITDLNRPNVPANASGNSGATNVSMTLKHDNKFSAETTPASLGCASDGSCTITVYFKDAAGNLASATGSITVDGLAPRVTIDSPASGNTSSTTINYNATVLEASPGTGVVQVTPDGQGATNYTLTNRSGNWGYTNLSLPNNRNTAIFMIDDSFANMNNTQSVTFTIDTIAPVINNVSSNATTVGASSVINLTANITDLNRPNVPANASGNSGATNVSMTLKHDNKFSAETTPASLGCASDGSCTITVYFKDAEGNLASATGSITVDGLAPRVTIASPASGNTSSTTINYNATVLEASPGTGVVQVTPDGQGATNYTLTNRSGNWGYTNLSLPNNRYTAIFMIDDSFANMNNTQSVTFTIDTIDPVINNDSSNATTVGSSTVINLTANITDLNRPNVPANASGNSGATNVSMTLKHDNKFSAETTPASLGCASDGSCTITVYFKDAAGNLASATGSITVDGLAPRVTIDSPAS